MKLLIELDEEYVKAIDKIEFLVGGRTDRKLQLEIIKAIKNGKALEQEPFINKSCVSSGVCEHDKNKVFDKIRAEIEPKCDRINSLASVLPYTAHREIQELLCEIMELIKADIEPQESEVKDGTN